MNETRTNLKTKTVTVEINMVEGKYELRTFMSHDTNEKDLMECVFSMVNYAQKEFNITEPEFTDMFTAILLYIFAKEEDVKRIVDTMKTKVNE